MSHDPSFRPSSADRWMECTGSVVIDAPPQPSGPAAERGVMMHALAEICLTESKAVIPAAVDHKPRFADLSPDDLADVAEYIAFVSQRRGVKFFEVPVEFIPGQSGYVDCVIIADGRVEIWDYKSGRSYVNAQENYQLLIYALGIRERMKSILKGDEEFLIGIVQPCLGNFGHWTVDISDLNAYAVEIERKISEVKDGKIKFAPSDDACRFCDAKAWRDSEDGELRTCPALAENGRRAAREAFGISDEAIPREQVETATSEEPLTLDQALALARVVEPWIKAIKGEAFAKMMDGGEVADQKLVRGRGSRTIPEEKRREVVDLLTGWGFDETQIYTDPVLRSPAQIEAQVKVPRTATKAEKEIAKERKAALGELVEKKPGNLLMVPVSDSRKGVERSDLARRDFAEFITTNPDEETDK